MITATAIQLKDAANAWVVEAIKASYSGVWHRAEKAKEEFEALLNGDPEAEHEQPTLLVYVEGGVVQGVSGTTDKIRVIIQDVDNEPRFEGDDLTDEPEIEVLELDDLWCKLRDNVPE